MNKKKGGNMSTEMQTIKAGTLIERKNADGLWHLRRVMHRVREAHDDGTHTIETLVSRNFVGRLSYEEIISKYRILNK